MPTPVPTETRASIAEPAPGLAFGGRLGLTVLLLLVEVVAMTVLVDSGKLGTRTWLSSLVEVWGAGALRMLILTALLTLIIGSAQARHQWKAISFAGSPRWISASAVMGNATAITAFAWLSLQVATPRTGNGFLLAWIASGLIVITSAALVFVPFSMWRRFFLAAPFAPAYGIGMSLTVAALDFAVKSIWVPWMRLTYNVVVACLPWLGRNVVADAATFTVGTSRFSVTIAAACSGYEGVVLMLVFGSVWLWFFRREFRFPQALLLLPAGAVGMWVLNCARIITLILIGDAGAVGIAAGGFHSQAGWIAFVVLAAGLSLVSRRIPWITVEQPAAALAASQPASAHQTADYLVPFLAILGAGILAHAASASFEWLYPLRVIAAAAALWWYRKTYAALKWRIGWESLAIGGAVFALWLVADRLTGVRALPSDMPIDLAAASALARVAWLAIRIAGAAVTVPLAEELAFRGYALRRLQSADFTAVDLRQSKLVPVVISSLLFGVMHGQRWIEGTIAGICYAAAARKRGSIGDAAAAHAVTNVLLSVWVLSTGAWSLW